MKAARRNPAHVLALGVRHAACRTWRPRALLSVGALGLGLAGLIPGSWEAMIMVSQTAGVAAVLGMMYRWVRQNRRQPEYVRVRA